MQLDVSRRLTHALLRAPWTGLSDAAELAHGTAVEVPCFIEPSYRRALTVRGLVVVVECDVLFLPSSGVAVGDRLTQALTSTERPLFAAGIVVMVEDSIHPRDGRLLDVAHVAYIQGQRGVLTEWVSTSPEWIDTTVPTWVGLAFNP